MKRSYAFFILFICLLLFFSLFYAKNQNKSELPEIVLLNIFQQTGTRPENVELYFWGNADRSGIKSYDDLCRLCDEFVSRLKIVKSTDRKESIDGGLADQYSIFGNLDNGSDITVSVQYRRGTAENYENYISVTAGGEVDHQQVNNMGKKIRAVFEGFGISPSVNTCIKGSFEGRLDKSSISSLKETVASSVDAYIVEGISQDNLTSVSAYSSHIDSYIKVNNKKVNLNLAVRYSSYDDRTYIWLATPVIATEY